MTIYIVLYRYYIRSCGGGSEYAAQEDSGWGPGCAQNGVTWYPGCPKHAESGVT